MSENNCSPLNQWVALNRILRVYQNIGFMLGAICLTLGLLSIYLATKPPVVVVQDEQQRAFYYPSKEKVEISGDDISKFIYKYIQLRYTWPELSAEAIVRNISPLVTQEFVGEVEKRLKRKIGKKKSRKQISQTVSGIRTEVTPKESFASFDRIIRVDGIPLISPVQLSFKIVRGRANPWNPMGLYVDGITIHEGR